MANELYCDNFIMSEDGENFEMTQTTKGDPGEGVPTGGTAGQVLKKVSDDDYDTEWADNNAGDVGYDSEETYQSGTVGKTLNDLSRQLSDLEDTVSTTQIINSASGAIASFDDGADGQPIRKLVANIEPVQDLHGYDSPWPAGGGDNKFDKTRLTATSSIGIAQNENGFVLTCLSAGTYKSIEFCIPFTGHDGEELYLKGAIANSGSNNGYFSVRFYDDSAEIGGASARLEIYPSRPTHDKTVPTGTTRILCVVYATSTASSSVNDTTTFSNIMLSLTNSAYTPYSNICPISGHTGAELNKTAKNLFGGEALRDAILAVDPTATTGEDENGRYVTLQAGFAMQNKIVFKYPFKANTSYTAIYKYKKNNTNAMTNLAFRFESGGDQYLTKYSSGELVADTVYTEKTTTQSGRTILQLMTIYASARATLYYDYFGIFEGNVEIADFVPYTGNQISVNWEDEAGTVYGGTLDLVSGVLTVDREMVDMGTLPWQLRETLGGFSTTITPTPKDQFVAISSCYPYKGVYSSVTDKTFGYVYNNHVFVKDSAYSDAESLKTALNGQTLCYELATPIEYQLTESEISGILETLYGTNNIWSSTGDTEVTYPADTKLYIDGKIAEAIAALQS